MTNALRIMELEGCRCPKERRARRLPILEYERAPIEEVHPAHLDHMIEIIVIEMVVERDFVDLSGCCQEAQQHSSDQPWSTHGSTGDAGMKL